MESDYLSLLHEIEQPIYFSFFEEEVPLFDSPRDPSDPDEVLICGIELVWNCKAYIGNISYSAEEYQVHVDLISEASFKLLDAEIIKLENPQTFLRNLDKRIQKSLSLFNIEIDGFLKNVNDRFGINDVALNQAEIKLLYQKFYNIQFKALNAFKDRLIKSFSIEKPLKIVKKPTQIKFKYQLQYKTNKTPIREGIKEGFDDLLRDLRNIGMVENKTINSLLYFCGLTDSPTKILWTGPIGNFYTFYRYLAIHNIVTGHTSRTLPNYVKFSKQTYDWKNWHSQKHTLSREVIEKVLQKFKKRLTELQSSNSS